MYVAYRVELNTASTVKILRKPFIFFPCKDRKY